MPSQCLNKLVPLLKQKKIGISLVLGPFPWCPKVLFFRINHEKNGVTVDTRKQQQHSIHVTFPCRNTGRKKHSLPPLLRGNCEKHFTRERSTDYFHVHRHALFYKSLGLKFFGGYPVILTNQSWSVKSIITWYFLSSSDRHLQSSLQKFLTLHLHLMI